ncbi:MAG: hypothetical protein HC846_05060 [Blastocatellia bacterium]|nr:hypothetical protein [Blastocatellia bacterium]
MKQKFISLILILIVSIGCLAQAQSSSKLFNAKQLLQDLQYLSTDEMNGRFVGTPESKQAREFIVKRFKESKITPFGDSFCINLNSRFVKNRTKK